MRAHLLQFDIIWEDRDANFRKVYELASSCSSVQAGDFILLPEMFDSGFSLNVSRTHDSQGRTLGFLVELAQRLGCWVQGGRTVLEAGTDRAFNLMSVIGPDGVTRCEYAKIHPFSYGREPEVIAPGDKVVTFSLDGMTACPAICYDLRFPELFRLGMKHGAELFMVGANWPAARQHHWRTLLIARAIENQAIVLGVNRTGNDPHLAYGGGTIAVGPKGEVLGELGDEQGVLSVELDPESVRAWRQQFPALRDARLLEHFSETAL